MASRRWEVQLEDGPHTVELEHGYVSGRREIRVDGREVAVVGQGMVDFGGEHPIAIGSHQGVVRISTNGLTFSYELIVDGRGVEPSGALGSTAASPPATGRGAGLGSTPGWAWAFVVTCLLLVPVGGAVGGGLGGAGAIGCLAVAGRSSLSAPAAVAACAAITVGTYGAYLLVVALLFAG